MQIRRPTCLLAFLVAGFLALPASADALRPTKAHAETAITTAHLLTRYHYRAPPLDDALSAQIFERYLKALDPARLFFLQSDIDSFAYARAMLDDAILDGKLEIPFAMFTRYADRVRSQTSVVRELLADGFDFTIDERYTPDRSETPWAASATELREIWRKRIKNDWLRLHLAGQNDTKIRATLAKRYEHALERSIKLSSDDVFQIFMNTWVSAIEPHTNYLGPRAAEEFSISMKLSLVGIGAVLQEREDYVTVRELIAGGPALRSGKINTGDRIIGVAQGEKAPMVDVTGWRVDEVVPLIRGKRDTAVVLDILPAEVSTDGEHRRVALVRDTVSLENQAASGSVREINNNGQIRKVGVVKLPGFYQDTEARRKTPTQFRSATRDAARIIEELKREKIDALLIDLRNNAGGSLDEAVSLTGLFIDTGPVVIQNNSRAQTRIERDLVPGMAWEGPLGVLINRASASASEIFAAAIQDYGRGIVIGESSFGKGTVQTMIDLDELERNPERRYGELKMTIAQFFRISGGATQLRGVSPDIALPSLIDAKHFGESSYDNALPWTRIGPADYRSLGNIAPLLPTLSLRHEQRIANDTGFRMLQEEVADLKTLLDRKTVSLKESVRRTERDRLEARRKARKAAAALDHATDDKDGEVGDDGLLANERSLSSELATEKARKAARDVILDETANILGDMVDILRTQAGEIVQRGRAKER
ncbi:MAG: carboxy terminal-processing peptidase [Azoarcus sp.]|jgi:carboxyl-terminal processing protease|nr:carboxy terminal-processing peptidase [Azoarcus sp.]